MPDDGIGEVVVVAAWRNIVIIVGIIGIVIVDRNGCGHLWRQSLQTSIHNDIREHAYPTRKQQPQPSDNPRSTTDVELQIDERTNDVRTAQ